MSRRSAGATQFRRHRKAQGAGSTGGDRLIAAARKITPDDVVETKFDDGFEAKLPLGIVIIQALHHGNDHRTHICTILGHHGVEYGDMDVWAYGDTTGLIVPVQKSD